MKKYRDLELLENFFGGLQIRRKIDKIFIPFYSTREGGSGIGLSFSKHVVYLHHGRIKVESIPGIKTTFTINFLQK